MSATGTQQTRLVVLRGNSGSGKSSTAKELRARLGRGLAWVEQDYLRRVVLREHDVTNGVNIGLIDQTIRYALDHEYHVILDGILDAGHYSAMLEALSRDHTGATSFYYFDVPFDETARRHATRPQAAEFTVDQMRKWYRPRDLLPFVGERIVSGTAALAEIVDQIVVDTGLDAAASIGDSW